MRAPAAAAFLVLAAVAPARAQSVDARLADLRLATAVRLALVQDASTRGLDVDATAEGGAVRLTGADAVNTQAERVARTVTGVRSVNGRAGVAVPAERAAEPVRPESRAETPRDEPARGEPQRSGTWSAAPRAGTTRAEVPRPEPTGPATHTVARGETLFSLARRYGTTVEALRRLNGLGPAAGIEIGQRLRLR